MRTVTRMRLIVSLLAVFVGTGCAHVPSPTREVHVISEDARGVGTHAGGGTGGAGADAYCNELQKQCFAKCWRRKPIHPTMDKHSEKHFEHCTSECLKVFMACVKEMEELERQESQRGALHFPTMAAALGWLGEHKAEVAIGTVVVIGGVLTAPYAIAVVGGALVLAPL